MEKHIAKKPLVLSSWLLLATLGSTSVSANQSNLLPQNSAFDVGIQALYLKPSFSDGYAYLDDTRIAPNVDKRNDLKLNWGWGFRLEGSYHFCPNSDLNLNWYHYQKSSNGTFVFRTNPTADSYSIKPEWDAINLEYGQIIHFDPIKNLRLHGGLQYARIRSTYHGNGVDPITGPGTEYHFMKFNGIGPRIGADLSVGIIDSLAAYFGGDVALLVGRSEFKFNETFGIPFSISGSRPTVVVPEIGLKIGAKYKFVIPCGGNLLFDAGYQILNYFNPLHLHDDFAASETNFALNGFYLGVKWITG